MTYSWSPEYEFSKELVQQIAPQSSGVFMILQSAKYPCYKGSTRILNIAQSESDLQAELLNRFGRHTVSNRLSRIRNQAEIRLTFKYQLTGPEDAARMETDLLRDFEDEYWDLPVLNSNRGYKRGEDVHYKSK